ncbi:hypothetical protein HPP92_028965 [Vanilla planifolia]|uniref:Uncharacterized protein n=1 Tax=Vanilla planifolia TaxID=51239 RepID=A0A835U4V4_VANPL|nr:hypothetical protein HPP92_028965 [Vanilla planifolia]KAG0446201.1 hypothetical protein HPP92_028954 [Vanilla planifolia]
MPVEDLLAEDGKCEETQHRVGFSVLKFSPPAKNAENGLHSCLEDGAAVDFHSYLLPRALASYLPPTQAPGAIVLPVVRSERMFWTLVRLTRVHYRPRESARRCRRSAFQGSFDVVLQMKAFELLMGWSGWSSRAKIQHTLSF